MDWQSSGYAAIQVAHNFGAVSVVGGPLFALWPAPFDWKRARPIAWLVFAGWIVQIVSGAAFGAASYAWYGHFPDIHGIAAAALLVKIACAVAGLVLTAYHLANRREGAGDARRTWRSLLALGATALIAAAFLRWLS
jgi:hypothetical protein